MTHIKQDIFQEDDMTMESASHTESVDKIVADAVERLKEAGFKSTKKRQEILRLFASSSRYMSATRIHQEMSKRYPTMSYNTTYRNIYDFVETGLLESTEFNQEQLFRFACLTHDHHHHHFICTICGTTIPLDACPMDHINSDLSGVRIDSHRFEVFGLCADCLSKSAG